MEPTTTSPTLYEAATEALVSDSSATSTFEKIIQVAFTHSTLETFAKEVKDTESLIRKEFEVSAMPGPWRSAKSVIQNSMKLGIGLVDDNGGFYGKTHLQNKIKELKLETKDPITNDEYVDKIMKLLMEVPTHIDSAYVYNKVKTYLE
jgi:hypothetical protein